MTGAPPPPGSRPGGAADTNGLGTPSSTVSAFESQGLGRLRRQRLVEALHRLGPRATYEFVAEVVERFGLEQHIDDRLVAYTERLTPELLAAVGADEFPASPVRVVGGRP
jgi:hypothetical protein